jgi:hypothetical protein
MKNLLKPLLATAVASCLFGISSEAAAGPLDFDRDSFFIVSAERMFGVGFSSTKSEVPEGNQTRTTTDSTTGVGLLAPASTNPYNTPLLGLHYSVIPALTVGASLGLTRVSTKTTVETNGKKEETEGDPTTGIIFAPRVGYILGFSNSFYLWARGGITYFQASSSGENSTGTQTTKTESTVSALAFSLDPMFVVTPVNRFGFMFGPVLDLGLSGKSKTETTTTIGSTSNTETRETDRKINNFGLQIGIVGYI